MRTVLYVMTTLAVIGLAFWAYRENYLTKNELDRADALRADIRAAHSRLAVLKAEWAYLNRPERLRDLANLNFDRLGLLPFAPEQFGRLDEVNYPPIPLPPITEAIELAAREALE